MTEQKQDYRKEFAEYMQRLHRGKVSYDDLARTCFDNEKEIHRLRIKLGDVIKERNTWRELTHIKEKELERYEQFPDRKEFKTLTNETPDWTCPECGSHEYEYGKGNAPYCTKCYALDRRTVHDEETPDCAQCDHQGGSK